MIPYSYLFFLWYWQQFNVFLTYNAAPPPLLPTLSLWKKVYPSIPTSGKKCLPVISNQVSVIPIKSNSSTHAIPLSVSILFITLLLFVEKTQSSCTSLSLPASQPETPKIWPNMLQEDSWGNGPTNEDHREHQLHVWGPKTIQLSSKGHQGHHTLHQRHL